VLLLDQFSDGAVVNLRPAARGPRRLNCFVRRRPRHRTCSAMFGGHGCRGSATVPTASTAAWGRRAPLHHGGGSGTSILPDANRTGSTTGARLALAAPEVGAGSVVRPQRRPAARPAAPPRPRWPGSRSWYRRRPVSRGPLIGRRSSRMTAAGRGRVARACCHGVVMARQDYCVPTRPAMMQKIGIPRPRRRGRPRNLKWRGYVRWRWRRASPTRRCSKAVLVARNGAN
jgi:hypothetical protein